MNKEVAYEITKFVVEFEQKITRFAEEKGLEINRLMLVIADDMIDDIKRGKLELMGEMTDKDIEESLNRLRGC